MTEQQQARHRESERFEQVVELLRRNMRLRGKTYGGKPVTQTVERAALLVVKAERLLTAYLGNKGGKPISIELQWERDAPYCAAVGDLCVALHQLGLDDTTAQVAKKGENPLELIRSSWCDAYSYHVQWMGDLLDFGLRVKVGQQQEAVAWDHFGKPKMRAVRMYRDLYVEGHRLDDHGLDDHGRRPPSWHGFFVDPPREK